MTVKPQIECRLVLKCRRGTGQTLGESGLGFPPFLIASLPRPFPFLCHLLPVISLQFRIECTLPNLG